MNEARLDSTTNVSERKKRPRFIFCAERKVCAWKSQPLKTADNEKKYLGRGIYLLDKHKLVHGFCQWWMILESICLCRLGDHFV